MPQVEHRLQCHTSSDDRGMLAGSTEAVAPEARSSVSSVETERDGESGGEEDGGEFGDATCRALDMGATLEPHCKDEFERRASQVSTCMHRIDLCVRARVCALLRVLVCAWLHVCPNIHLHPLPSQAQVPCRRALR